MGLLVQTFCQILGSLACYTRIDTIPSAITLEDIRARFNGVRLRTTCWVLTSFQRGDALCSVFHIFFSRSRYVNSWRAGTLIVVVRYSGAALLLTKRTAATYSIHMHWHTNTALIRDSRSNHMTNNKSKESNNVLTYFVIITPLAKKREIVRNEGASS